MDGVVHNKIVHKKRTLHNPAVEHPFRAPAYVDDVNGYCVYELGRPYCMEHRSFRCSCTERAIDYIDTRALLTNEDDQFTYDETYVDASMNDVREQNSESMDQSDPLEQDDNQTDYVGFTLRDLPIFRHNSMLISRHISIRFVIISLFFLCGISAILFVGTSYAVKQNVDASTQRAIASIKSAMGSIAQKNFTSSGNELQDAHEQFMIASDEMSRISKGITYLSQYIPGASELSTGYHIIEAGKYLTRIATDLHNIVPVVIENDSKLLAHDKKHVSFLALYQLLADSMDRARYDLAQTQQHIDRVHSDDVPTEHRQTLVHIKEMLPEINESLRVITESRSTVEDMLGSRGPRTYLLLFQNNHEIRATGGFIGSYGIVRVKNGEITTLMVDDIYNIDGQLIDRIVPPLPIQKISADWSLHDSNWFADFPVSARKAMDFYERTGGATVDGVIAITPEMMRKFLTITGPITVESSHVELTADNYMHVLRDEIEDRAQQRSADTMGPLSEEHHKSNEKKIHNQPKQILSEVMPIMMDKLFDREKPAQLAQIATAISHGLKERHIILYMSNDNAQSIIENNGWAGTILDSDKDYLSVINTNINGFKTDGVIEQQITHHAQIDHNGFIVNTVSIHRKHNGGLTTYPWWDAVNANYMRIYVPEGTTLISVEGHTREINEARLNYDALGYERDSDVVHEESSMHIDEETGTRIYNEANKTVFANWVYVSPQESVTVRYTYRLPFRISFHKDADGQFGSYAILFQKQSGSDNVLIESDIDIDDAYSIAWHSHNDEALVMRNDLNIDRYNAVVLRKQ